MERVGVLLISYGSRAACIADALCSSDYKVEIFDADKQRNPFILERSVKQRVTGLDIEKIRRFASRYRSKIDFGIVGPENPIIDGVRDLIEEKTGIPMICPTKEYAVEGSKVAQRKLLEKVTPEVNPRFRIFHPGIGKEEAKGKLFSWLDELENQVAVKPDIPATGKGVGVWGDHFSSRKELWEHFLSIFRSSSVIVEEKIRGEEFSLQFFSDGKHLVPTPAVRDYKRAYDGDLGPNTGGMGSYKDKGNLLPWMKKEEWEDAIKVGKRIFSELKGNGSNPGLRGIPMYMAYVCTKNGLKLFEINSRPGDPEILNLLPLLEDDFVDLCFRILDGNLRRIRFKRMASVATYAVPLSYGGYRERYTGSREVQLKNAYKLREKYGDQIRIYPGSMEVRGKKTYALGSRAVAIVGIGGTIQEAREISIHGIREIDGPLWNRWDIASSQHIRRSFENLGRI
jgi:phosphoribosylamine--glycine ligase